MKKRLIVAVVLMLCVGLLFAGGRTEQAAQQHKIVVGTNGALGSPEHQAVMHFAERVSALSGGRITADGFSGELGPAMDQIEGVMGGTQQVFIGELTWFANLHKDLNIVALAFAFQDNDHIFRYLDSSRGQAMWAEMERQKGVKILDYRGQRLPRVVMSKRPLRSVADFQGLAMRVPEIPIYMRIWDYAGTNTNRVAWGEMYMALAGGLIEAHEGPIDGMLEVRTFEQAPYMHRTDHVYSLYVVAVNADFFNKLPNDLQEAVRTAARESNVFINTRTIGRTQEYLNELRAAGTTIIENDQLRNELRTKLAPIAADLERDGFWSAGLYDFIMTLR